VKIFRFLTILLSTFLFLFGLATSVEAATYYVAKDGSGDFTTIQAGADAAGSGDTVYVRAGIYHELIRIRNSGNSSSPITISGYPGERPIIDGEYTLPEGNTGWCDPVSGNCLSWSPLINISGSHVIFQNFEVKNSRGRGIQPNGSFITVKNSSIHNTRDSAMTIYGSNVLIENNKVWMASDYAQYPRRASELNWSGGIATQRTHDITIRGNEVFNVWGEGIIPMNSKNITIEDNVVYDNFAVNIYLATVEGVTIQRNLVYNTNTEPFLRGGNPCTGITFATEQADTGAYSSNQVVINNIIAGHRENIAWWGEGISGALINTLIANNTLINATANSGTATNLAIDGTTAHNNVRISNNIIMQNTPGTIASVPNDSTFTFSNNLWSKTPEADARGSGDIIASPKLVNANAELSPGDVDPNWYKLTSSSPAINKAIKLSEVFDDFFGATRGNNPDIGAHEYDGSPQITNTPTDTPTPTQIPGDGNGDGQVDGQDFIIWLIHFGQNVSGVSNGDYDKNDNVEIGDYKVWIANYSPL
jgi:parallel beta-helix repeat protein